MQIPRLWFADSSKSRGLRCSGLPSPPVDAFPEDLDIAVAVDNFSKISNYPVNDGEHSWAGLRTFARDRLPVVSSDPNSDSFFG